MTDQELALVLIDADGIERKARTYWEHDRIEREHSVTIMRHAVALKRSLEQLIAARAMRSVAKTA